MKQILLIALSAGVCLGVSQAEETTEVMMKTYSHDFICYRGASESSNAYLPDKDAKSTPVPPSVSATLESFSTAIKLNSTGIQELPAMKLEFQGKKYVLPSRKIVVVEPHPEGQGVFVESALDPNGSGTFEVLLAVNWPVAANDVQRPAFNSSKCPEGLKVNSQSSSWSTTDNLRKLNMTLIFNNTTGQPIILKPEWFDNLPDTKDWPVIEILPASPKA